MWGKRAHREMSQVCPHSKKQLKKNLLDIISFIPCYLQIVLKRFSFQPAPVNTIFSMSVLKTKGETGQLDIYFQGDLVNLIEETIVKGGESQYMLGLAMSQ